jgi:hypothetical protein
MAYSYVFDPIATEEYEDAFSWYEKKSYLATDNFIIRMQEAISAVCANHTGTVMRIRIFMSYL